MKNDIKASELNKEFIKYIFKPNIKELIIIGVFVLFSNIFLFSIPYVIRLVSEHNNNISFVIFVASGLIVFSIANYVSEIAVDILYIKFIEKFALNIRKEIFRNIYQSSSEFIGNYTVDFLFRVFVSDIDYAKKIAPSFVFQALSIVTKLITILFFIFAIDIKIGILILITMLIVELITLKMPNVIKKKREEERLALNPIISTIKDYIHGNVDYRYNSKINNMLAAFEDKYSNYVRKEVEAQKHESIYMYVPQMVNTILIGIIILMISFLKKFNISMVSLIAYYIYISQLIQPIQHLFNFRSLYKNSQAILIPIFSLVNDKKYRFFGKSSIKEIKTIELKNFNLKINNIQVFDNYSTSFKKGCIYIIKGRSGIGKSTFIKTLLGLINSEQWMNVFYNNIPLSECELEKVIQRIEYIPQDIYIINDSFENNISFYLDYKKNAIEEIINSDLLKLLNKDSFDNLSSNGFDNISGGEKKKIAIGRFLLRKDSKDVVIFDETFTNLDEEFMHMSINMLTPIIKDKIVFVISHDNKVLECIKKLNNDVFEIMIGDNDETKL